MRLVLQKRKSKCLSIAVQIFELLSKLLSVKLFICATICDESLSSLTRIHVL